MKPKVMLHFTGNSNISGPNTSMARIKESLLKEHYTFGKLIQDERPGKLLNIRLLKKLINQIIDFKPDIIHVSGLQLAGFYAVLAARLAGYKNIVTVVRGSSTECIGFNPIYKFIFRYFFEPLTILLSRNVYTVCEHLSEKFKINKRKNYSGVIHNPAPKINPKNIDKTAFRNEMEIDSVKTVVSIVGRMVYDKGISFVIKAIKKIDDKNIVFVFVGDGPYCDILKNELKDEINIKRVFVLGKRDDVLKILAGSNIFLFATLHENLSNALLEACTFGLAVIATSVGGNKEVITNEVNGILIPPFDSEAIKGSIKRLHNNKEEMIKFGEGAKKNVEKNFSQEKIFMKVSNIYSDILGKT